VQILLANPEPSTLNNYDALGRADTDPLLGLLARCVTRISHAQMSGSEQLSVDLDQSMSGTGQNEKNST